VEDNSFGPSRPYPELPWFELTGSGFKAIGGCRTIGPKGLVS